MMLHVYTGESWTARSVYILDGGSWSPAKVHEKEHGSWDDSGIPYRHITADGEVLKDKDRYTYICVES